MYKLLSIVLVLWMSHSYAQQDSKLDSLKDLISAPEELSQEEQGAIYRNIEPAQQLMYAHKALEAETKSQDIKGQGIAMSEIATHYQRADNYGSAYFFEKTIPYFKGDKNRGNSYARLSAIQRARGNFVESI